jgi:hypothetical protein
MIAKIEYNNTKGDKLEQGAEGKTHRPPARDSGVLICAFAFCDLMTLKALKLY